LKRYLLFFYEKESLFVNDGKGTGILFILNQKAFYTIHKQTHTKNQPVHAIQALLKVILTDNIIFTI